MKKSGSFILTAFILSLLCGTAPASSQSSLDDDIARAERVVLPAFNAKNRGEEDVLSYLRPETAELMEKIIERAKLPIEQIKLLTRYNRLKHAWDGLQFATRLAPLIPLTAKKKAEEDAERQLERISKIPTSSQSKPINTDNMEDACNQRGAKDSIGRVAEALQQGKSKAANALKADAESVMEEKLDKLREQNGKELIQRYSALASLLSNSKAEQDKKRREIEEASKTLSSEE
ncbi:MAG: hypothetical protein HY537_01780, partial [Deltaproteobacteria bacterium]|nr:hypothetical protein [Deltaproteobacteria bacterium]